MRYIAVLRKPAIIAIAACLLFVFAAACGRSEDSGGGGGGGGSAASPGITDKEIKIGTSTAFSGPASAYAAIIDGVKARFAVENAKGGVNNRKITYITLDDGYEPQRAVTNVRRLVEQDKVFALFQTLGTANNLAIWDYANQQKVPQVFVASGGTEFGADPAKHPYTIGWQPDYTSEAKVYADYVKKNKPNAKVAILYQNDSFGKTLKQSFEDAIKGSNVKVVTSESYEATDPTVTSQIRKLASSGADTFLNVTTPKFGAQAIAGVAKSGWKPLHILNNVSASKSLVLEPVGLASAKGIVSEEYFKDPEDPAWANDAAMREYKTAMKKYSPKGNPDEPFSTYGYAVGSTLIEALKGMKEPTRDSFMESVKNMDVQIPMLLPGVKVQTGADDYYPIQSMQIMQFNGQNWKRQGQVIDSTALSSGS